MTSLFELLHMFKKKLKRHSQYAAEEFGGV